MKIFIVGLGLMGASYALKLHQLGHDVFGYDINKEVILKAQEEGFISHDNHLSKLMISDVIILALYPKDNTIFIESHQHLFRPQALLTDISGVKGNIVSNIESILRTDVRYVSHHPMAGRAKKGFQARDHHMFLNSNVIIIEGVLAQAKDYLDLETLIMSLGFKRMIRLNAVQHDEAIAYTSQLTHIIASTLMDGFDDRFVSATGDSFRDLTRIANINEVLWTELFLDNKKAILESLSQFQAKIEQFKTHITNEDEKEIEQTLKRSRLKREAFEKHS